ncbi:MAG: hypothetical protein APF81_17675 [Desulfosporosinus sp. BRH_c37]|nr:MAG: hypothetical protein APF81_17675 [Desulfosporosinus sp. BRH_c37]
MKVTTHQGDDVYFVYDEQKIFAVLQRSFLEKDNYSDKFEFDYMDIQVIMFYDEEDSWYTLAQIICRLIDKYGKIGFEEFNKIYHEKKSIEKKYIVVDNKVYKPYINNSIRSGEMINYIINIQMSDDTRLDGIISGDIRSPYYNNVHNKDLLMETLRSRVKNYYQNKNVLPSNEYYQEDITDKYQKIIDWYKENKILK